MLTQEQALNVLREISLNKSSNPKHLFNAIYNKTGKPIFIDYTLSDLLVLCYIALGTSYHDFNKVYVEYKFSLENYSSPSPSLTYQDIDSILLAGKKWYA